VGRRREMKGFIEVTAFDGTKVFIAVSEIMFVDYDEDNVYIVLRCEMKKKRVKRGVIYVNESYDEIVAKIKEATE